MTGVGCTARDLVDGGEAVEHRHLRSIRTTCGPGQHRLDRLTPILRFPGPDLRIALQEAAQDGADARRVVRQEHADQRFDLPWSRGTAGNAA
jgi:hypothetical protein